MWWTHKQKVQKPKVPKVAGFGRTRSEVESDLAKYVSLLVRAKANWRCVICGKDYSGNWCVDEKERGKIRRQLNNSHYFSRGGHSKGVWYDLQNCDSICIWCHQIIENNKHNTVKVGGQFFNYEQYKRQQLGEQGYLLLEFRANQTTKYSVADLELLLTLIKKEYANYEKN